MASVSQMAKKRFGEKVRRPLQMAAVASSGTGQHSEARHCNVSRHLLQITSDGPWKGFPRRTCRPPPAYG